MSETLGMYSPLLIGYLHVRLMWFRLNCVWSWHYGKHFPPIFIFFLSNLYWFWLTGVFWQMSKMMHTWCMRLLWKDFSVKLMWRKKSYLKSKYRWGDETSTEPETPIFATLHLFSAHPSQKYFSLNIGHALIDNQPFIVG